MSFFTSFWDFPQKEQHSVSRFSTPAIRPSYCGFFSAAFFLTITSSMRPYSLASCDDM